MVQKQGETKETELQDEVTAWLKKYWPFVLGIIVAVVIYAMSSWILPAAVAVLAGVVAVKIVKKHGGPKAAYDKVVTKLDEKIDKL
jgi:membrane protein YdbS with pleckstrin-like domain